MATSSRKPAPKKAPSRRALPLAGYLQKILTARVYDVAIESALEAGFIAAGVSTLMMGPLPTPGVAYITRSLRGTRGFMHLVVPPDFKVSDWPLVA